jgi:hypothetical protein
MDTPLSEEAVRDAYFLGQHHDQSFSLFLAKYTKSLPMPKTGPDIAAISFLTPFALIAQESNQRTTTYSAQQAEEDHRNQDEVVQIVILIHLTETYRALIPTPTGSNSNSPIGFAKRPDDFWKDFEVQVVDKDKTLVPLNSSLQETRFIAATTTVAAFSAAPLSDLNSPPSPSNPTPPPSKSPLPKAPPSPSTSTFPASANFRLAAQCESGRPNVCLASHLAIQIPVLRGP